MTTAAKTTTARKSLVLGFVAALAVTGALVGGIGRPALANDGTPEAMGAYNQDAGGHYEGEKVTISPGIGNDVYAEWHYVDGEWVATFLTYNYNQVTARPSGGGWTFWVNDGGRTIQVVRTAEEGAGVNTLSHWREVDGIGRY